MRILILAVWFPPGNSMAAQRTYSWARYWSAAGHDVTVVTTAKEPSPLDLDVDMSGFTLLSVPWMPRPILRLIHRRNGVRPTSELHRQPSVFTAFLAALGSPLLRLLATLQQRYGILLAQRWPDVYLPWRINAALRLRRGQPWDVVVSSHGPYASHLLARSLKRSGTAIQWIADYRDLWTNNHMHRGLWPFTRYEDWLERRTLRSADAATAASDHMANNLRTRNPGLPVCTIPNGFEPSELAALPDTPYFPNDGIVRIAHTGWIHEGVRNPAWLFAAVAAVEADVRQQRGEYQYRLPLELLFVGPPSDVLSSLAQQYGVAHYVVQTGPVPRPTSLHIQRDCDVLLLLEVESDFPTGVSGGKIFEYMASGSYVWSIGRTVDRTAAMLLEEHGKGVFLGHDVAAISAELHTLLSKGKGYAAQTSDRAVLQFTRQYIAMQMLDIVTARVTSDHHDS